MRATGPALVWAMVWVLERIHVWTLECSGLGPSVAWYSPGGPGMDHGVGAGAGITVNPGVFWSGP